MKLAGTVETLGLAAEASASTRPQQTLPKPDQDSTQSKLVKLAIPPQMPALPSLPLLICSIGNPGSAYAHTLHSAGHTAILRLAAHLGAPAFQKERTWGNGLVTRAPDADWALWQSPTYMNESGKGVRAAHSAWNQQGRLIVVHDELEKPLGNVTVKTQQGLSAKGHNGIKSCLALLGGTPFVRIGVGIGRPVSRDPVDVSRYVLKKMTPAEKAKIENAVDDIVVALKKLESG